MSEAIIDFIGKLPVAGSPINGKVLLITGNGWVSSGRTTDDGMLNIEYTGGQSELVHISKLIPILIAESARFYETTEGGKANDHFKQLSEHFFTKTGFSL